MLIALSVPFVVKSKYHFTLTVMYCHVHRGVKVYDACSILTHCMMHWLLPTYILITLLQLSGMLLIHL
jgi:hypothetical protein